MKEDKLKLEDDIANLLKSFTEKHEFKIASIEVVIYASHGHSGLPEEYKESYSIQTLLK
jgi:hypothetical protein